MICKYIVVIINLNIPDSIVHGANMGPTWVLSAPDGPHEPCFHGYSFQTIGHIKGRDMPGYHDPTHINEWSLHVPVHYCIKRALK